MIEAADELAKLEQSIWQGWTDAVSDRNHPLRLMTVSTIGDDGAPRSRTVVLRDVKLATREVVFHTDARSAKVAELAAEPRMSLLAWDHAERIQLRAEGEALLQGADTPEGGSVFRTLTDQAKDAYRSNLASGVPIDRPEVVRSDRKIGDDPAARNFVLVRSIVKRLEWLKLDDIRQSRAEFLYREEGTIRRWIAP